MQTFLPYPDFIKSLQCLDNRRLGKQRVEAYQILNTISGNSRGWINHPAVKMWRGYEQALTLYMNLSIIEWIKRGFKNTMKTIQTSNVIIPHWIGYEPFHASHRSNLLRKNFVYYSRYGWTEDTNLPYIWPVGR